MKSKLIRGFLGILVGNSVDKSLHIWWDLVKCLNNFSRFQVNKKKSLHLCELKYRTLYCGAVWNIVMKRRVVTQSNVTFYSWLNYHLPIYWCVGPMGSFPEMYYFTTSFHHYVIITFQHMSISVPELIMCVTLLFYVNFLSRVQSLNEKLSHLDWTQSCLTINIFLRCLITWLFWSWT